jgi:uncharacterized protein (TIGR00730 family)
MFNGNTTVVVFAAANDGHEQTYRDCAYDLGKRIAEAGFTLANGAGPGLMSEVSRGAKENGGYVIGVGLKGQPANPYIDVYNERIGIHSRQSFLFSMGDAFICLPGGLGTLYEISEIAELKKLREEEPEPVIVLNHNGFYDCFKNQLDKMRENGFILSPISSYIDIVEDVDDTLSIIKSFYGILDK